MQYLSNPFRTGTAEFAHDATIPDPSVNAAAPLSLLHACPAYAATPLVSAPEMARALGIAELHLKDERARMGMGSFKALGAAYVIAHDAQQTGATNMRTALSGQTYVTASAGNHGLSVAAGAAVFGADAVVYVAETVPDAFAKRLRAKGARVVREGATYEHSMAAAARAAATQGWQLLSDSSWPGYTDRPHRLMEGYVVLMHEAFAQIDTPPTHILLQAGVGGLAAACAASARTHWGDAPKIIVVEPDMAPALYASVTAGAFVPAQGGTSDMGRLDCKEASLIALQGLVRDADGFALISEDEGWAAMDRLAGWGFETTPSGAAGLAAALADTQGLLGLEAASRVMVILSEGPTS